MKLPEMQVIFPERVIYSINQIKAGYISRTGYFQSQPDFEWFGDGTVAFGRCATLIRFDHLPFGKPSSGGLFEHPGCLERRCFHSRIALNGRLKPVAIVEE